MEQVTIERRWLRWLYLGARAHSRVCAHDPARAHAIADALHNLPVHLADGTFDERLFDEYVEGLLDAYPDLAGLREEVLRER